MGTQFWWFFDAVVVCVTIGFIYTAAAKGFNKGVFRLAGFGLAIVLGLLGSAGLQGFVYQSLFRASIEDAIMSVVSDEEWDVFQEASEQLAISAPDDESVPDPEEFERIFQEVSSGHAEMIYPDWFISSVCDVTEAALVKQRRPHSAERMAVLYDTGHDYQGFCTIVKALHTHDDTQAAVSSIETTLYQPGYLQMIRMAVLLIIGAAILLIFGIISAMAGSLEELMHLGKSNHVLGVLVGIVETAGILLFFIAAVRMVITMTDGQMLVFNPETIGDTKLFRYLYDLIPW
ncbi:MAG: CvpA family protein [Oscillospiraceae bacterium]|nr:CvpA family protein [Oscillospiraceae bacterium]